MTMPVALRPSQAEDEDFLFELYASTRADEMALVGWDAARQETFLKMQFDAQTRYYLAQFPDADYRVVLLDDQAIGRLIVNQSEDEILLMDIALLPEHRGAGIGAALIRDLQAEAARTGKPVRLHVEHFNRAGRLYERLGFSRIGGDGIYSKMEWRPAGERADRAFKDPVTTAIVNFLIDIGLDVRAGESAGQTFLPGIMIDYGALLVDETKLKYPGDLLHEAGHLALMTPDRRKRVHVDVGKNAGEEMGAIAWSYAALLHLHLDPAIVFHAEGYRGGSGALIDNFAHGRYIGVPVLQWLGLAAGDEQARKLGLAPYPHLLKWLRDE